MTAVRTVRRRGFTLIELLMVIAIMVFLMAVAWVGFRGVLTGSKEKATRATIRKIDGLLGRHLSSIERDFEKRVLFRQNPYPPNTPAWRAFNGRYVTYSTTDPDGILERKIVLRGEPPHTNGLLPQTFTEAGISPPNPSNHNPATESAAALYHILVTLNDDAGTDDFSSQEAADTDGDGLVEFIDAWGRPLRFYRWPTRLVRPALSPTDNQGWSQIVSQYVIQVDPQFSLYNSWGTGGATASTLLGPLPEVLDRDPDDGAILSGPQWAASVSGSVAQFEYDFHTPETWCVPLIVSAGLDGEFGLFAPADKGNHGHLAQPIRETLQDLLDNITNRN